MVVDSLSAASSAFQLHSRVRQAPAGLLGCTFHAAPCTAERLVFQP